MPSLSRVLFCTLPTALVLALLSAPITPVAALASPLPMPLQADYASRMPSTVYATHKLVKKAHLSVAKHNHTLHGHVAPPRNVSGLARPPNPSKLHSRNRRDNSAEFDALLGQFSNGRDNAVSSSQGLQQLASQSASEGDSPGFQQDAAANFSAFHDTIQSLRALLGSLPADKGLANYDRTSELESILKDFVNANKDALTAVNVMMYNVPGLGPVLGPIVYDLKCLLDDILDATENVSDGLLNDLGLAGMFGSVATQASTMACGSQLKVLGLCV